MELWVENTPDYVQKMSTDYYQNSRGEILEIYLPHISLMH